MHGSAAPVTSSPERRAEDHQQTQGCVCRLPPQEGAGHGRRLYAANMSLLVEKPVVQEPPRTAPRMRSAAAVGAALLAVYCLLYGLSFPGFPLWAAGWALIAAAVAVSLVVASAVRALRDNRSKRRSALTLAVVGLVLAAGVATAEQDDGGRLADPLGWLTRGVRA